MDTIYDLEITSYYIQLFHPSKQASIFSEAIKKIWPVGYLRNAFYASCGKAIFPRHNLKHKTFPFVFSDALYLRKWLFCLPFKCFRFHASFISRHLHFLFPSIWIWYPLKEDTLTQWCVTIYFQTIAATNVPIGKEAVF